MKFSFFKGKSVLVTGGTGFIGSHLCRALLSAGAAVHVSSRNSDPGWRLSDAASSLTCHRADLTDETSVSTLLSAVQPSLIFHFAADTNVDRSTELMMPMLDSNVRSTLNLLMACPPNVERFVYAGTCEEYGMNEAPFREDMRECPVSPYSMSKVMGSHLTLMMHQMRGTASMVVRPFLTYGPGQDNKMFIPALIRACLEGRDFDMTLGEQTREFNYIDDIVEGILAVTEKPEAVGQIINIGNSVEHRLSDVADHIVQAAHASIQLRRGVVAYRPGEAMRFFSDSSKFRRLTGKTSFTDLKQGLEKTLVWFRQHLKLANPQSVPG